MSIFGKKPAKVQNVQKSEPSIEINGCKIEGKVLRRIMYALDCNTPELLQKKLSEVFSKLDITAPLSISEENLITEDGKLIRFIGTSSTIFSPRYPIISITQENIGYSYFINGDTISTNEYSIEKNGKTLTFSYPTSENHNRASIRMNNGKFVLDIQYLDKVEDFIPFLSMEDDLFTLELTEKFTPAEIYKIISRQVNLPVRIEYSVQKRIFYIHLWRIKIKNNECISYMESQLNDDFSHCVKVTEYNFEDNTFRYEESKKLEFSFKKGEFKFTVNSEQYAEAFNSCQAIITAFKEKMKHILD